MTKDRWFVLAVIIVLLGGSYLIVSNKEVKNDTVFKTFKMR